MNIKERFKRLYREVLKLMPTKLALYVIYFRGYHKILNLRNPKYYGEKIQWLKLNGELENLAPYVDKYLVREYVEKKIGQDYLFRLLGIYNNADEIDFDKLPNKFVIKSTNGSQSIIICKDKSKLNIEKSKIKINNWLLDDFYKMKKEPQYKNIDTKILVEEYMEDDSGELRDYKFYCFNGEPKWFAIYSSRYSDKKIDTYSIDGSFLYDCKNGGDHVKVSESPINIESDILDKFKDLSRRLSEPFTYVRVDFYLVNGKIYFGELTFTDGAGSEPKLPLDKYDIEFAKLIPLSKVLK